ncbi:MAG: hypothetical protein AVDCRST_MAG11-308 [uncultured Gemmatimonadaceae bacterium]|uniref:Uncharacterized protein n=1 Tax=uncultured Gemmatimonadaceae bacterium TaxID=246130 RepID=A0A6J4K1X5_9BACT|nr:MAG: hypothetical protein AVDCRST_MAG11-308 [uncultured Gemmatimonadaceae bacterium]
MREALQRARAGVVDRDQPLRERSRRPPAVSVEQVNATVSRAAWYHVRHDVGVPMDCVGAGARLPSS